MRGVGLLRPHYIFAIGALILGACSTVTERAANSTQGSVALVHCRLPNLPNEATTTESACLRSGGR
jgi:hypothetical protein